MDRSAHRTFESQFGAPREVLLDEWKAAFTQSPLRLRARGPADSYANIVETLLDGLLVAVSDKPTEMESARASGVHGNWAARGSSGARELEQAAAICGAALAADDVSGFDVGAVMTAFRDVVLARGGEQGRADLAALLEWLGLVALDAFGHATAMAARERAGQDLEDGTPVFSITPNVAALIWLGSPDTAAAEGIVGRLILHLVRTGATALVVDVTRLADSESPAVNAAMKFLLLHRKVAGAMAVVIVDREPVHGSRFDRFVREGGGRVRLADRFDAAVEIALRQSGAQVVQRPAEG